MSRAPSRLSAPRHRLNYCVPLSGREAGERLPERDVAVNLEAIQPRCAKGSDLLAQGLRYRDGRGLDMGEGKRWVRWAVDKR